MSSSILKVRGRELLEEWLVEVQRNDATALHVQPNAAPCMRIDSKLEAIGETTMRTEWITELLHEFLFADHREQLEKTGAVDVLYVARSGQRFRTWVTQLADGPALTMRRVRQAVPTLEGQRLPELLAHLMQFQSGLIVVSGFYGAGKSATVAAMVERMVRASVRNVVTVEHPIEFVYEASRALVHQREVGAHVDSIADGVRQAVRLGADVVIVSELPDLASLEAVLYAVERGLLVLTTIEAGSVVGTMYRLIGMAPPEERSRMRMRVAAALRAVIGQTLLADKEDKRRVPLLEVLIQNESARSIVRQGRFEDLVSVMERGHGLGMQTVDIALRGLLKRGEITKQEALYHAVDREAFRRSV